MEGASRARGSCMDGAQVMDFVDVLKRVEGLIGPIIDAMYSMLMRFYFEAPATCKQRGGVKML